MTSAAFAIISVICRMINSRSEAPRIICDLTCGLLSFIVNSTLNECANHQQARHKSYDPERTACVPPLIRTEYTDPHSSDRPPSFTNSDSLTFYNKSCLCSTEKPFSRQLISARARVSHLCFKVVSLFKYFDWLRGYRRRHVPIFNSTPPPKKWKKSLKKSFSSVLHQEQRKHLLLPRGLRGPV